MPIAVLSLQNKTWSCTSQRRVYSQVPFCEPLPMNELVVFLRVLPGYDVVPTCQWAGQAQWSHDSCASSPKQTSISGLPAIATSFSRCAVAPRPPLRPLTQPPPPSFSRLRSTTLSPHVSARSCAVVQFFRVSVLTRRVDCYEICKVRVLLQPWQQ